MQGELGNWGKMEDLKGKQTGMISLNRLEYSEKYFDNKFEYRMVTLPRQSMGYLNQMLLRTNAGSKLDNLDGRPLLSEE